MAKYTMYLKDLVEQYGGIENESGHYEVVSMEYGNVDEIMDRAIPRIFDFDFPIYDEKHRKDLCKGILLNYMYEEIAHDTPGHFKLRLRSVLNQIMPRYNGLYETAAKKYDYLNDVDFGRILYHSGTQGETSTLGRSGNDDRNGITGYQNASEDSSKRVNKFSDTPQGTLKGLEDNTYMSSAEMDENDGKSKGDGSQTNLSHGSYNDESVSNRGTTTTVQDIENITGKRGMKSYAQMISEYRETLLNIDKMIIDELNILFMGLWA